jgi:hypothetical protein
MIAPRSLVRRMLFVLLAAVAIPAHAQPNPEVRFGEPIASGGLLAVLAENPSDQLLTFAVAITYRTDGDETRTVMGDMRDLLPGQRRAVTILSDQYVAGGGFHAARATVDHVIYAGPVHPLAARAARIELGEPVSTWAGALPRWELNVTNTDDAEHALTLQYALLDHGQLTGVALGTIESIAPGETQRTLLLIVGPGVPEHSETILTVDAMLR